MIALATLKLLSVVTDDDGMDRNIRASLDSLGSDDERVFFRRVQECQEPLKLLFSTALKLRFVSRRYLKNSHIISFFWVCFFIQ
jgi:hypothetical protein